MIEEMASSLVDSYSLEEVINKDALREEIRTIFGLENIEALNDKKFNEQALLAELKQKAIARYEEKEQEIGETDFRELERVVMLKVVDQKWMDHIDAMDELKDGIGLRAYGQKDPVVQYRIEGTEMFDQMVYDIHYDVVRILLNMQKQTEIRRAETARITNASLEHINDVDGASEVTHITFRNEEPKVGRNDLCPCGSGLKYKNCHGKNE
jgi:preprotein translocase subunit SecA